MFKHLAICLALLAGASSARASLIIDVGNISLLPDTPNQKVPIYVSGGDSVIQVQFKVQIADGGIAVPGQPITGPSITSIDLITGTIFGLNHGDQSDGIGNLPQLASFGILTQTGAVPANDLLATITIDTTDFAEMGQSFNLNLTGTLIGNTVFNNGEVPVTITNGTITISSSVPEPATGLVAIAGAGLLLRRRKRGVAVQR